MTIVNEKCLVEMEKALNLWMEGMNKKCLPIEGRMLCQQAWYLDEEFSKESLEMSDTKLFSASKG